MKTVAEFTLAVSDDGSMDEALACLNNLAQAEAVLLVRVDTGAGQGRRVAVHTRDGHRFLTPRDRPSLAGPILACEALPIRAGQMLLLSDLSDSTGRASLPPRSLLAEWSIREVAVVPLESARSGMHVLELQFATAFPEQNRVLLISLAGMLATLWARRTQMTARQPIRVVPRQDLPILSDANPIGLSRAEYRVCMLVRDGHRSRRIAEELGIHDCTVRSHLRSIYAKADVDGHVGLLHRLVQSEASCRPGRAS